MATDEPQTPAKELLAYQVELDQNAKKRYAAFRVGSRDDPVTALGWAVQVDPIFYMPWDPSKLSDE